MTHPADILQVLELPELRECVVPECLMQGRVSVFVYYVQVRLLLHQQPSISDSG